MRKIFTTKKRIAIAVGATAVVLATGGTAFAYYLSTGTGTGTAAVGSPSNSDFTVSGNLSTALYPGDIQNVTVTVTNTTSHPLSFKNVIASGATATTGSDTTDVLDSTSNPVSDCLASWFGGTSNATSFTSVPGTGGAPGSNSVTITVPVTFTNETDINQTPCASATGGIKLSYSISNS